jgi:TolA-binding protein
MFGQSEHIGDERRQYVRLDSVFPVQFQLMSLDGSALLSDWVQGFTNNISSGGLCLEVVRLKSDLAQVIKMKQAKLVLALDVPISRQPVKAIAAIAWTTGVPDAPERYFVGLRYDQIDPAASAKLIRYAWFKKLFAPVAIALVVLLGIGFGFNAFLSLKLAQGNRALVGQLIAILQDSSVAQQKVKQISRDREDLQLKLEELQQRIQTLEGEKEIRREEAKKIDQLNAMTDTLNQEKAQLQDQLIKLEHTENSVTNELLELKEKRATLEQANLDKMYQWLRVHQNPSTGLVMSFEGDGGLADTAFIYDQSLVAQLFVNFADYERAKRILNFLDRRAKRDQGLFFNAYYSKDGSPAEFIVHSGPNIWVGIAALHYSSKTQDRSYLRLAEDIARAMINLQQQDGQGGIRGGPHIEWYSTEHNLDAYAFFSMLHKVTGKEQYAIAAGKVLNWLIAHTYDKNDIPIKRGKGDATIATDTYAWSIAAIGPEKLESLGMNPDRIMDFAEQNCAVEVTYQHPQGHAVKIRGFDFVAAGHAARGGIISSEWTAQMVISFNIMADYYYKKDMPTKGRSYKAKAEEYAGTLANMVISSASPSGQGESCLPYATAEYVDTGHGWMTPRGATTGSVAGTVYTMFAYYNYNPLELK